MRECLERLEALSDGKSPSDIILVSHDATGNFKFLVKGVMYSGVADGALVARMATVARRQPGRAFNMVKEYAKRVEE